MSRQAAGATRRAPRLGPADRIAGYITRRGRFVRIDPTRGRELPGFARLLGFIGWALLVEESLRRAWVAHQR